MTIDVRVNPASLAAVERKLTPDIYLPSVHDVLRDASKIATTEAQRGAARDIGAIANSIMADVRSPMEIRVHSSHPGVLSAEFGRKAGTPPPPMAELRGWAERHGMGGLEFVLARSISRRGIKGRFFLRAARDKLQRTEMPVLLNKAAREIERKWAR